MSMDKLQTALPALIGRTIRNIVVSEHENGRTQLFLYFYDGTYYEFYSFSLNGIRSLDVGDLRTSRSGDFIPARGRLEILDAKRTLFIERPAVATPPLPMIAAIVQKTRWQRVLERWIG